MLRRRTGHKTTRWNYSWLSVFMRFLTVGWSVAECLFYWNNEPIICFILSVKIKKCHTIYGVIKPLIYMIYLVLYMYKYFRNIGAKIDIIIIIFMGRNLWKIWRIYMNFVVEIFLKIAKSRQLAIGTICIFYICRRM